MKKAGTCRLGYLRWVLYIIGVALATQLLLMWTNRAPTPRLPYLRHRPRTPSDREYSYDEVRVALGVRPQMANRPIDNLEDFDQPLRYDWRNADGGGANNESSWRRGGAVTTGRPKGPLGQLKVVTVHQQTKVEGPCDGDDVTYYTGPFPNMTATTPICLREEGVELYVTEKEFGTCFNPGTRGVTSRNECACVEGWTGVHCSVPQAVSVSDFPTQYGVALASPLRRVIYGFPFTIEFDMLENRLYELDGVVDLYIIVESNYTVSGLPKRRLLYEKLLSQADYLSEARERLFLLSVGRFPAESKWDGWAADEFMREVIAKEGMAAIGNLKEDDLFVLTDADELPSRAALLYLKVHYGYPEPIGFHLQHTVFGYDWIASPVTNHVFGACSIKMLRLVFQDNAYYLRRASKHMNDNAELVKTYKYTHSGRIHEWSLGALGRPAGWHCSWCFSPEGVRFKMAAAHMSDVPRWGNVPEKLDLDYIKGNMKKGLWFDDDTQLTPSKEFINFSLPERLNRTDHVKG